MAAKRKKRVLSKVQMVKELSRERIGLVPSTKVVPQRNKEVKQTLKHPKKTIENEIEGE